MDREKIEEKYKWKLEDLYENKEEYDKDLIKLSELVDEFEKYKGKILENDNTLLETLLLDEKIDMLTNTLYVYANMKLHEDTRVGVNQELAGNLDITLANINERISFFVPELLEKDYSYVEKLIEKLVSEIEIFQEEVKAKNAEIQNFDGDITKLNEKKRKYDEECIWLNSIKELIEGEKL